MPSTLISSTWSTRRSRGERLSGSAADCVDTAPRAEQISKLIAVFLNRMTAPSWVVGGSLKCGARSFHFLYRKRFSFGAPGREGKTRVCREGPKKAAAVTAL